MSALPIRQIVDDAIEGRGWTNARLADAVNDRFAPEKPVTAGEIADWRRFRHEPRAGLTMAALSVLNLLHIDPRKIGFGMKDKPSA